MTEHPPHSPPPHHTPEWLAVVLSSLGDGVIATDMSGDIVFLNPVAEQLTGWNQVDAHGRPVEEVFVICSERTGRPVENPVRRVLALGDVQKLTNHTMLICRDGTKRSIADTAAPILDAGKVRGVALVFRDVTERRRTERGRETRLEVAQLLGEATDQAAVLRAIPEILARGLLWDAASICLFDAEEALRCHAAWAAPESEIGQFFTPDRIAADMEAVELATRACAAGAIVWLTQDSQDGAVHIVTEPSSEQKTEDPNTPRRIKHTLVADVLLYEGTIRGAVACPIWIANRPQGALVLYSPSSQAPDDDLAETLTTVANQVAQFVQRERAEAESRRHEGTLRFLGRASDSLATLVDYRTTLQRIAALAVPDFADWCVIHITGKDGAFEQVAWVHRDPARAQQVYEAFLQFPTPTDVPYGVSHVLRTGTPELIPMITDAMLERAAQGEEHLRLLRDLQLSSSIIVPLVCAEGITGALRFTAAESGRRYTEADLKTAQDLASRASIAIENARLYEQLREADHRKDEFIATLAHELRNPLAPLRTGLELLQRAPAEAPRVVATMQRQLTQLIRLADDLLDISRIAHGKVGLRLEVVALDTVLDAALATVHASASRDTSDIAVLRPQQPIWVYADPVRLTQVIQNLLINAVKYTDPGDRIEVEIKEEDDAAVLRVCDEGIGIAPEFLPRIFEPFAQAASSPDQSKGGLGIGLSLVKHLVELHGGTVAVSSAGLGRGSEFTVKLPLHSGADALGSGSDRP